MVAHIAGRRLMGILKIAFSIFPPEGAPLAFSALDLAARMPVAVSNPHRLTHALQSQGLITFAYKAGRQNFFWAATDAVAPDDPPRGEAAHSRTNKNLRAARRAKARKTAARKARG